MPSRPGLPNHGESRGRGRPPGSRVRRLLRAAGIRPQERPIQRVAPLNKWYSRFLYSDKFVGRREIAPKFSWLSEADTLFFTRMSHAKAVDLFHGYRVASLFDFLRNSKHQSRVPVVAPVKTFPIRMTVEDARRELANYGFSSKEINNFSSNRIKPPIEQFSQAVADEINFACDMDPSQSKARRAEFERYRAHASNAIGVGSETTANALRINLLALAYVKLAKGLW